MGTILYCVFYLVHCFILCVYNIWYRIPSLPYSFKKDMERVSSCDWLIELYFSVTLCIDLNWKYWYSSLITCIQTIYFYYFFSDQWNTLIKLQYRAYCFHLQLFTLSSAVRIDITEEEMWRFWSNYKHHS
jgi:hypothetical protein